MDEGKENKDFLKEDGYLTVQACKNIHKIIFHPNLNVFLIFTNSTIFAFDVNSAQILKKIPALGKYIFISINDFAYYPLMNTLGNSLLKFIPNQKREFFLSFFFTKSYRCRLFICLTSIS